MYLKQKKSIHTSEPRYEKKSVLGTYANSEDVYQPAKFSEVGITDQIKIKKTVDSVFIDSVHDEESNIQTSQVSYKL